MSDISGHIRRTKTGKTVQIRPHRRERNKIVDPGDKYVEMGDKDILVGKLTEHLAQHKKPVTEFVEKTYPFVMDEQIGFLGVEALFLDSLKDPVTTIDFYTHLIEIGESIPMIVKLAEIVRVLESEELTKALDSEELLLFYTESSIDQLDDVIEASSWKTKIKRIKKHLKSIVKE